mgnify:CR=1 FL=1
MNTQTKTAITALEYQQLKGIKDSQYHDGAIPIGNWVWFEAAVPTKSASGVCASLTKKGLAMFQDLGARDHIMCITDAGFDAVAEYERVTA